MPDKNNSTHPTGWMDRISLAISYLAMLCIPVMVLAVAYEIVMRYAFSRSTSWVNDLTVWLGAACYVISGVYAMQKRAHISITLLYDVVPKRVKRLFDVISLVVVLVFAFGLIAGAGPSTWDALSRWERIGTTWNPPIPGTIKPLILFAVFIIALQAVANFISDWRRGERATPPTTPEVD